MKNYDKSYEFNQNLIKLYAKSYEFKQHFMKNEKNQIKYINDY